MKILSILGLTVSAFSLPQDHSVENRNQHGLGMQGMGHGEGDHSPDMGRGPLNAPPHNNLISRGPFDPQQDGILEKNSDGPGKGAPGKGGPGKGGPGKGGPAEKAGIMEDFMTFQQGKGGPGMGGPGMGGPGMDGSRRDGPGMDGSRRDGPHKNDLMQGGMDHALGDAPLGMGGGPLHSVFDDLMQDVVEVPHQGMEEKGPNMKIPRKIPELGTSPPQLSDDAGIYELLSVIRAPQLFPPSWGAPYAFLMTTQPQVTFDIFLSDDVSMVLNDMTSDTMGGPSRDTPFGLRGAAPKSPCMACMEDLDTFCTDAEIVDSDPNDLSKKFADQMCLVRHYEEISSDCAESIDVEGNIAKKCFHDIDTRCGAVEPGDNQIHNCLWSQVDALEPQCADHIERTAQRLEARKRNQAQMPEMTLERHDIPSPLSGIMDFANAVFDKIPIFESLLGDDAEMSFPQPEGIRNTQYSGFHEIDDGFFKVQQPVITPSKESHVEATPGNAKSPLGRKNKNLSPPQTQAQPPAQQPPAQAPMGVFIIFMIGGALVLGLFLITVVGVISQAMRNSETRRTRAEWKTKFQPLLT